MGELRWWREPRSTHSSTVYLSTTRDEDDVGKDKNLKEYKKKVARSEHGEQAKLSKKTINEGEDKEKLNEF